MNKQIVMCCLFSKDVYDENMQMLSTNVTTFIIILKTKVHDQYEFSGIVKHIILFYQLSVSK